MSKETVILFATLVIFLALLIFAAWRAAPVWDSLPYPTVKYQEPTLIERTTR